MIGTHKDESTGPAVLVVANFSRHTGYAWWLMEKLWVEIESVASAKGLGYYIAYPPASQSAISAAEATNEGPRYIELSLPNWSPLKTLSTLSRLRKLRIRYVYFTDQKFRSWRYAAMRLTGVQRIVVHDHTPGDRPPVNGLKGWLKRLASQLPWYTADLYVAVSPLMRERHLRNARIPPDRTVTVTNGVPHRQPQPEARATLLSRLGLSASSFLIVGIGRMNAYKRFDFAIECLAALASQHPELNPHLILVGDGPELQNLKSLGALLGVSDRLTLTGKIQDAWPITCGVDAAIHPSAGEGLSLAIMEMMLAGKPVVVPDIPSVCQTISSEKTGLIYRDGDIDHAVSALARLGSDPMLRQWIGRNAQSEIERSHTIEQMLASFRDRVVNRLLETS